MPELFLTRSVSEGRHTAHGIAAKFEPPDTGLYFQSSARYESQFVHDSHDRQELHQPSPCFLKSCILGLLAP